MDELSRRVAARAGGVAGAGTRGVTGIIAIAESHLCIHTWPEHGYAAVDSFTCGTAFMPGKAADLIIERLRCKDPSITELKRGLISETTRAAV